MARPPATIILCRRSFGLGSRAASSSWRIVSIFLRAPRSISASSRIRTSWTTRIGRSSTEKSIFRGPKRPAAPRCRRKRRSQPCAPPVVNEQVPGSLHEAGARTASPCVLSAPLGPVARQFLSSARVLATTLLIEVPVVALGFPNQRRRTVLVALYPLINVKSSSVTVPLVVDAPTSQVPLVTAMPVSDSLV